jgi:hypothetical protein
VRKINLLLAFSMAGAIGGSACAMQRPVAEPTQCAVIGANKLPAGLGGGEAICAAIRAAVRERGPTDFAVEVRVESASAIAANVRFKDGRTLPEQKLAVSDRPLNRGSIERFAAAIADAVAGSATH